MIGVFLLEILPLSARPGVAGAAPQGNKHILNGEAGKKMILPWARSKGLSVQSRFFKARAVPSGSCCAADGPRDQSLGDKPSGSV